MGYRYIGNKTRILDWVLDAIESVVPAGATIADPMCGTASVSAGLKARGFRVIASDIMTYSFHHAQVRLLLDEPPPFAALDMHDGYAAVLDHLNHLEPRQGLFLREYSPAGSPEAGCEPRMYFTAENASRIDAIRAELKAWDDEGLLSSIETALLRHDLVLAVNDVANIAGTYGHHRSKWSASSRQQLTLSPYVFDQGPANDHLALLGAVEDLAPDIVADLCYLDPPYMKRQYAANYHILETLARGDDPQPVGVSGLRDWWDQYSNFCSKRNIHDSLETVLRKMGCSEFLISYSEDGLIPMDQLLDFLAEFGTVSVDTLTHQRFRSNDSPLRSEVTEFLIHVSGVL